MNPLLEGGNLLLTPFLKKAISGKFCYYNYFFIGTWEICWGNFQKKCGHFPVWKRLSVRSCRRTVRSPFCPWALKWIRCNGWRLSSFAREIVADGKQREIQIKYSWKCSPLERGFRSKRTPKGFSWSISLRYVPCHDEIVWRTFCRNGPTFP